MVRLLSGHKRVCRHLHIPLQSGSNDILASMGRHYSSDFYLRRLQEISESIPQCCLGADVIAGFPGETDRDHCQTIEMINRSPLKYLHVFSYSAKRDTEAALMKNHVNTQNKTRRMRELRSISQQKSIEFIRSNVGSIINVLPDNTTINNLECRVISDNYIRFNMDSSFIRSDNPTAVIFSNEHAASAIDRLSKYDQNIGNTEDPTVDAFGQGVARS